jgi:methyl-accepting chemotaxis protein WspA
MRDSGGRITGLATVDFSLADLQDMIGRMRMTPGTQAAAVDRSSGRIIAYSADPNLVMDEPDALPWGDQLNLERNYPPGRAVRSDVQYGDGSYFLFSAPADADILLALLVPRSELFAKIHRIRDSAYWVLAVVVAALLLLTAAIVHLAGKHVVGPIVRATATARSIAAGDLRAAARDLDGRAERPGLSRDEIGQLSVSFATMTERLNHLIGDLQETGGMINTSSGDIGRAAGRIEADMSRQEEAAREVTDFSERISENSRRLAHNMRSAGGAVEETAGLADEGRRRISRMYDGLNDVLNASTALNRRLGAVGAKTANINRIVTTITKVADQINLLSLNAAIESEKAGEQGRGFAVVAREIRRLADQASIAVWDIEDTLKKTSDAIEAGMTETDRFTGQVKEGVREINEIGRQLEAIIERVQNLPAQIQGLNRDVEDQAGQAQRAGAALVELTDLTQDITARMRGFMEVAGRLREVARNLDDQISEFKVESQDTGEE